MVPAQMKCRLAAAAVLSVLTMTPAQAATMGCLLTPSKVVEVGSPVVGVISEVLIEKGRQVEVNQPLVVLRADIEKAQLALASTRASADAESVAATKAYEYAKRRHERNADLVGQGFISGQALDQSLAELQMAQAKHAAAQEQTQLARRQLNVARAELGARTIRSPFAGVVVDVYRHEGERVEEKPVVRLARVDPLYAEVVLPAALHGRLRTGQQLRVKPLLNGMEEVNGEVHVVDQLIDPASNTFRVRLIVPNPQHAIPAGLRCDLKLPSNMDVMSAATESAPVLAGKGMRARALD